MKEFAVYTALRTGIFVATYIVIGGAVYLVTDSLSSLWPLVLAAVVSVVISSWLLRERRDRLAQHIAERAERAAEANRQASEGDPEEE